VFGEGALRVWGGWTEEKLNQHLAEAGRCLFDDFLRHLAAANCDQVKYQVHFLKGDPIHVIGKVALALQAGLVVMGTFARTGLARRIIGNTAEAVLRQVNCSVLAVKASAYRAVSGKIAA
jgi:nucleotide-binding universal stress UspA family protein